MHYSFICSINYNSELNLLKKQYAKIQSNMRKMKAIQPSYILQQHFKTIR